MVGLDHLRTWSLKFDREGHMHSMLTPSNGNIFRVTGLLCENSPVTDEFPVQRTVTRNFDVFFDLRLNKRLSKQSRSWWVQTPSRPLWRHCNGIVKQFAISCRSNSAPIPCLKQSFLSYSNKFHHQNQFVNVLSGLGLSKHSWYM